MREQAGIGIGTIALVAPADAGNAGIDRGERIAPALRRASRGDGAEAAALVAGALRELPQQCREIGVARRHVFARRADQQHGVRRGQCGDVRRIPARLRQPQVVDRMQAAQHLDDVAAAQAIVLRRDHQVPVARIDARVEDLHRLAAACAQQARRQRGLPAAADGELWRSRDQRIESGTESAIGSG